MGSVYSRPRSPYLWIKYYQHGRVVRESTETTNPTVARRVAAGLKLVHFGGFELVHLAPASEFVEGLGRVKGKPR
jgi:hypothetical protein